MQGEGCQDPGTVGDVRRGDVYRMGKAVGVHRDGARDARDQLAAVIALLLRCVGVLDALRDPD